MSVAVICPQCRRTIPADAPRGECPGCLMMLGFLETPDGSQDGTFAVTVAAATVSASGFASSDPDATLSASDTRAQSTDLWPSIPGYQIVGELGEGGGGKVYKALQLKADKRVVALKVLHGNSKTERERMAREAKSLGRLSHPNIVTVYEVGDSPDGPYFTMEFMPGGSLAELIKKQRPSPMESAKIVEAVSRGVAAAHAAGILHRDLKPSNVLLAEDGTPKVADFGLAKFADGPADASTLEKMTPTGAILGTPAYMAPEQAAGRTNEIDERTDVYGLGAVLYHCLTGRAPFSGTTHPETTQKVLQDEVVPPRSLARELHPDLEAVCLKCLEKKRSKRFASVEEIEKELHRYQLNIATFTRPVGFAIRLRKRFGRHRKLFGAAACLITLLGSAVLIASAFLKSRVPQPPDDPKVSAYKELAERLRRNEEVILIGPTGAPAWSTWNTGPAVLSTDGNPEAICSFQTATLSMLELVPQELVPTQFKLQAEVRHDADARATSEAGIYWGYCEWEAGERHRAFSWQQCTFNDSPDADKKTLLEKAIRSSWFSSLEGVGKRDQRAFHPIAQFRIQPGPPGLPRKWRTIQIEWLSNRITLAHVSEVAKLTDAISRTAKEMNVYGRELALQHFPSRRQETNANQPRFGKPGSIGIVVQKGQGTFRNVVLTPVRDS